MVKLSSAAIDAGYRLEFHETVTSTNALALERALEGDEGRLWVVSTQQTSGRGRRGRAWNTSKGNLAATVMLSGLPVSPKTATIGFVAGLSLSEALGEVLPDQAIHVAMDGAESGRSRFELKWPNDVLTGGAKLSGILLETVVLGQGRIGLAVGIGVNVVSHPDNLPYPATSLRALGSDITADVLFESLSAAWLRNIDIWDDGRGMDEIRRRWLHRAAGLGGRVAVRLEGRVVAGIFDTIDEECRFVIREDDGTLTRITAGDVHFGAVATARAAQIKE